jgi:hypothetical protein
MEGIAGAAAVSVRVAIESNLSGPSKIETAIPLL